MSDGPKRVSLDSRGKPLNVLLIVTDQERARHLIPEAVPLPQRDRLMEQCTVFQAAQTATNLCSMSRGNLYTGLHAQHNGVWENAPIPNAGQLRRDVSTLGHLFQDAGFTTGYFGKWHLTAIDEHNPPGRDVIRPLLAGYGFEESDQDGERDGTQGGWRYDPQTADSALTFINRHRSQRQNRKGERPWLAAVNFVNPHDIMFFQTSEHQQASRIMEFPHPIAVAPDDPLYAEDLGIDLPANFGPATLAGKPPAQREYQKVMELVLGEIPFDRPDLWSAYQNYYLNCLRDVDRQIGRVLDGLEQSGQLDDTLILYTADHGEMGGVHGLREKSGIPYREVSNVPLWIRHPDARGGASTQALTSMVDVLPTLLSGAGIDLAQTRDAHPELCGVDLMKEVASSGSGALDASEQGGERTHSLYQWTSLIHLSVALTRFAAGLRSATTPEERAKAAAGGPPDITPNRGHMRGVFDGRFKFARYFSPRQHHHPTSWQELLDHNDLELYDTHADPGETQNLASDPAAQRERIESPNRALNELVEREIGVDDGSFLPGHAEDWQL